MPPILSTRVSMEVPPSPAEERTLTFVLSSPGQRYVDLRPIITNDMTPEEKAFPFEWAFAGSENALAADFSVIEFTHNFFDSAYIIALQKHNLHGVGAKPNREEIGADIGNFATLEDGSRRETGEMEIPPGSGEIKPYIEIWKSLDPSLSSPDNLIQLFHGESTDETADVDCIVFDIIDTEKYEGRLMKVGKWAQGLLWDKQDQFNDAPIYVIRCCYEEKSGKWEVLLKYGDTTRFEVDSILDLFPIEETVNQDDVVHKAGSAIEWTCVEKYVPQS